MLAGKIQFREYKSILQIMETNFLLPCSLISNSGDSLGVRTQSGGRDPSSASTTNPSHQESNHAHSSSKHEKSVDPSASLAAAATVVAPSPTASASASNKNNSAVNKSDELQLQLLKQLVDAQLNRDNVPLAQLESLRSILVQSLHNCNKRIEVALMVNYIYIF